MQAAGLAAAVRARLPEARGDRDGDAADVARHDLELVALADRRLVDVAGEDELRTRVNERGEHTAAPGYRLLSRSPRSPEEMVVEHDDAQRRGRGLPEELSGVVQLSLTEPSRLLQPRSYRVEPDDEERV
jgi:hypothetical protein